tara:strand:+ start:1209 stop:1691 length:483 start_codon:yes stop_codon:yes gene_type:complete
MAEEFETLTPAYLIHTTPQPTTTIQILEAIVNVHTDDYHKILDFTSRIKILYNTVNMAIRMTYGRFIPDWTTHAQFSNINYSGKKRMFLYIQLVNDLSHNFSQIVNILQKYNDYNNKRYALRQQKVNSNCYGNYHYPYNSKEQIEYFVAHYNPCPTGLWL